MSLLAYILACLPYLQCTRSPHGSTSSWSSSTATTIVPTRHQGIVPDFQQWGYYNDDDHVPSSKLLLPPSARECHPLAAKRYLICWKDFSGDLLRAFKFLQTNMLWLKWHRRWLVYYAIVLLQDVGECGAVHSTMILVILESPFFNAEENHKLLAASSKRMHSECMATRHQFRTS